MKTILKFTFLLATVITFNSCKKEITIDYKYSDKESVLKCDNVNKKLISEAVYTFEEDIKNFYANKKFTLRNAYSFFINGATNNRIKYEDIVSKHAISVLDALKQESDLWDLQSNISQLNYNNDFIKCIANSIKNERLKTTFNALLNTNSMRPNLMAAPLSDNLTSVINDKNLSAYIALQYYYANLVNIDFSKIDFDKKEVGTEKTDNPSNKKED